MRSAECDWRLEVAECRILPATCYLLPAMPGDWNFEAEGER